MEKDDIIVYVYSNKKMLSHEHFKSITQACRYAERQVLMGYYCEVQRLEYGRCWAKFDYKPKESI